MTKFFKGLYQFLDIPIIYHCANNHKKVMSHFWEKRWTDGRADRLADNGDFIGPSVGRGSKKIRWLNTQ